MIPHFPDAIFVPMPLDRAAEHLIQSQPVPLPVVLFGNLHMLNWPADDAEKKALVSRCADDLPPPSGGEQPQVYALDALCRPLDARPPVDWQDVVERLPRTPVVAVIVLDGGSGWLFAYDRRSRSASRQFGRIAADGIASFRRQRRLH